MTVSSVKVSAFAALILGGLSTALPAADVSGQSTIGVVHLFGRDAPVFSAGVSYTLVDGKLFFGNFTLTKKVDATSPRLLLCAARAERCEDVVEIEVFEPDGTPITQYRLTDITIVGVVVEGETQVENVRLDYRQIEQIVQTPHGPVDVCWDRTFNSLC